jgi:hypothetical protein
MESPGVVIGNIVRVSDPHITSEFRFKPEQEFFVADVISDSNWESGWRLTLIPRHLLFSGNPYNKIDVDLNCVKKTKSTKRVPENSVRG